MYLISPNKQQFKANLHCHSTRSDGRLSPSDLKQAYKEHGYHILAITDHEFPKNHSYLNDENFLLLTGYEAYIRTHKDCRYDVFAPEIHLNLFARDPENETLIGYNPAYCKYLTAEEQQALTKAGPTCPRAYTTDYINSFIESARQNGYLVAYNHPVWSMESEERILSYNGIFSFEMVNGNSNVINRLEYNGALYNALLRNGKYWFVHAADDNHNVHPFDSPECDSFRAFTVILADKLEYDAVINAMENGEMYASTGPIIREARFENGTVRVQCSPASVVICHDGSKHPPAVYAQHGGTLSFAEFTPRTQAPYIRISVIDENGNTADTRAFSCEELGLVTV